MEKAGTRHESSRLAAARKERTLMVFALVGALRDEAQVEICFSGWHARGARRYGERLATFQRKWRWNRQVRSSLCRVAICLDRGAVRDGSTRLLRAHVRAHTRTNRRAGPQRTPTEASRSSRQRRGPSPRVSSCHLRMTVRVGQRARTVAFLSHTSERLTFSPVFSSGLHGSRRTAHNGTPLPSD